MLAYLQQRLSKPFQKNQAGTQQNKAARRTSRVCEVSWYPRGGYMKKQLNLLGLGLLLMSALRRNESEHPIQLRCGQSHDAGGVNKYSVQGLGLEGNEISIRKLDKAPYSLTLAKR
jgi:hypothetical protein